MASAEAINATLLALEHEVDEVRDISAKLHLNDFKDDNFGIIRDAKRLLQEFSWHKGYFFLDLIGKLIEKKTNQRDSKFSDLARRLWNPKLHLVATNLNTRSSEVYFRDTTRTCWSRKPSDDPCPFPFSSLQVREDDGVFVDGSVQDNYPVRLFDCAQYFAKQNRPRHTTKPKAYAEAKRKKIENFFD